MQRTACSCIGHARDRRGSGEYATIARRDRNSKDWYVGAATDSNARTLAGKTYVAEICREGDQADYRSERRFDLVVEKRKVTAKDVLQMKLAPGGGQAIRFAPQR